MKKSTLGILIAVMSLGLIAAIVLSTQPKQNSNQGSTSSNSYTLQEVAQHNTQNDCWMAINESVYDVTSYVRSHPGGSDIVKGCGKDATELFENRRDGNERIGSGTPHTSSAHTILEQFKVGSFTN